MKLFEKIKNRKGITGTDVATAITIIVFTVGLVTAIYVNTINKSKDNVRYANAIRIATNIIENIQKKPYEYVIAMCSNTVDGKENSVKATNGEKIFETKVQNGFTAIVTAKKTNSIDIVRDITINIKYRSNNTYKTITLSTVKEKEFLDMTNEPDYSLIPGYNPSNNNIYYYPVKKDIETNSYKITAYTDINWYDYEENNYAIVCQSTDGLLNIGQEVPVGATMYVWIPRFVSTNETGIDKVQFLYGTSDYAITYNQYDNLFAYGVKYSSNSIREDSVPEQYKSEYSYTSFEEGDGLTGVWYEIGGSYSDTDKIKIIAEDLNEKMECNNATLPSNT